MEMETMINRRSAHSALLALLSGAVTLPAHAQGRSFPNQTVKVIVPFAPGGGADVPMRLLADRLREIWGTAIVLDNRIGYIPVQRFNETSADEVQTAVNQLQREGAKGIILDFRGNPGGILEQSIAMSNLFLSMNDRLGIKGIDRIGDSSGRLKGV